MGFALRLALRRQKFANQCGKQSRMRVLRHMTAERNFNPLGVGQARQQLLFALGAGYNFGDVHADIAYMGVVLGSRSNQDSVNFTAKGDYPGGLVHVISLAAGVKL